MILKRVLDHLAQSGQASVEQIARAVGASPDAVQGMLDTLCRHGSVDRRQTVQACSGCARSCPGAAAAGGSGDEVFALAPRTQQNPPAEAGGNGRPDPGKVKENLAAPVGQSPAKAANGQIPTPRQTHADRPVFHCPTAARSGQG